MPPLDSKKRETLFHGQTPTSEYFFHVKKAVMAHKILELTKDSCCPCNCCWPIGNWKGMTVAPDGSPAVDDPAICCGCWTIVIAPGAVKDRVEIVAAACSANLKREIRCNGSTVLYGRGRSFNPESGAIAKTLTDETVHETLTFILKLIDSSDSKFFRRCCNAE
uniref:Phospholipid scramblase n=1 Tax=Romanomermis culicivorax TaxID=13658 RepID=A0A915ILN8_ROMCU